MDRQLLHNTLSIQTHSRHTEGMQRYILRYLSQYAKRNPEHEISVELVDGNIYATKGRAHVYPCVVAHTDTVHRVIPDFVVNVNNGVYTGKNRDTGESHGVGGDDKVGIAIALTLFAKHDIMKVAFFPDEEIGCVGSFRAELAFFEDCAFVLQADRKGNTDVVRSVGGVSLYSLAFAEALLPLRTKYAFHEVDGMMTDVYALRRRGLALSTFNVSCGYWNPHTANERVVFEDVERTTQFMSDVITELGSVRWPNFDGVYSMFSLFEEEEEEEMEFDDDDIVTIYEAQRHAVSCTNCGEFNIEYDESVGMSWCWTCQDYFWVEYGEVPIYA